MTDAKTKAATAEDKAEAKAESAAMAARRKSGDDNPADKALGPAMSDLQPGDARLSGKDNPSQFGHIRGGLVRNKPE